MNTTTMSPAATADLPRAGFWRRFTAVLIDVILVILPFQILAAVLFSATAGKVQMYSGLTSQSCDQATIPLLLDPPPPHDANFAQICRFKLFGATTGALLTVGRATKEDAVTTTLNQSYMADEKGDPVDGIAVDWIALLTAFAYLIIMIWKTGKTVGARLVGIRYVNASEPGRAGIPLSKAILRYLAMSIGCVPALTLLFQRLVTTDRSVEAIFSGNFLQLIMIAALMAALWYLFLIFQITRKRDPVYDRLAGTMVIRDARLSSPA